jgi:hypothetical protein
VLDQSGMVNIAIDGNDIIMFTLDAFIYIKESFDTISLHKTQFNFTNFTIKKLNHRVGYSVWLGDQLHFYENEILMGIVPYTLEMMF